MILPRTILDTDILSAVMKRHPAAFVRAASYIATHGSLTISIITRYEVRQGLLAKAAAIQTAAFDSFCSAAQILPIDDATIVLASELYAELRAAGQIIGDADILIAATALIHGCTLATNNVSHFARIPGLQIDNWMH